MAAASVTTLVAVSDGGALIRGTDAGAAWILDNSVSDSALLSVSTRGGRAVAVGVGSVILRSDAL